MEQGCPFSARQSLSSYIDPLQNVIPARDERIGRLLADRKSHPPKGFGLQAGSALKSASCRRPGHPVFLFPDCRFLLVVVD
ncbi:MAG: hypothetical protein AB7F89_06235 [Pirellulaceae bacterium]